MQITTATYKRQAFTGHNHTGDGLLQPGRVLKITSKIPASDGWCLRTASDTQGNIPNCIPAANVGEIAITPTPLTTQPVRTLTRNLAKINLRTGDPAGDTIGAGRIITFSHQVRVNGTDYLISQVDSQAGKCPRHNTGVPGNHSPHHGSYPYSQKAARCYQYPCWPGATRAADTYLCSAV